MIKAMICFVAWLTNGSEIVLFTAKATSGSFTTSNADAVRGGIKPETKMISWDTYRCFAGTQLRLRRNQLYVQCCK